MPLAGEEVREFYGQDDGFLQGFFGLFETCDIFPVDIGFFAQDGAGEGAAEFFAVGVLVIVVAVGGTSD